MLNRIKLLLLTLLAMARRKPWEPALIIVAVIIATAGLSSVWLINEGARQGDIASDAPSPLAGARIVASKSTSPLTRQDYVAVRKQGFTQFIATSEDSRSLVCTGSEISDEPSVLRNITLLGVDMLAAPSLMPSAAPPARQRAATGMTTFAAPGVVADINCLTEIERQTGDNLAPPLPVNGLPDNTVIISLAGFYTGTVTPQSQPLTALIAVAPISESDAKQLKDNLPAHLVFEPASAIIAKGNLSESFRLNLWAMGVLMGVVALFIVINAMLLMYRSRLPVAIRLRQLGVSARLLQAALVGELAVYCLISTPIGVFTGLIVTRQLTPVLQQTFAALFDSAFVSPSPFLLTTLAGAFVIALGALTVFSFITARQLTGALSVSALRKPGPGMLTRIILSLVAVSTTTLLVWLANSTLLALISVAAVLLAGCLLIILWLPAITQQLVKISPAHKPLLRYIIASTSALSGKTRLAVCAFFIALSANIGMNVMTDSFRQATADWLSQRLSAPAYLYTEQPHTAFENRVKGVKLVYEGFSNVEQISVEIRSFPGDDEAQQSLALSEVINSDTAQAWQLFAQGKGVFINQQLAFREHLQAGQNMTLGPVFTGRERRGSPVMPAAAVVVAGIYPDYGNPSAQVMLPISRYSPPGGFAGVVALYPETAGAISQYEDMGTVYITDDLIDLSMQTFDRTFVVTDALNVATLLVAGLSFAISISVLMLDIKPQLSVLRGMGVYQWQIKLALLSQYMLFCLITALLALPFGIFLAWVFIARVNRYAFYWVYTMEISIGVLLQSVLLSLLVVFVVLLLPLGRVSPKVDLRQEAAL